MVKTKSTKTCLSLPETADEFAILYKFGTIMGLLFSSNMIKNCAKGISPAQKVIVRTFNMLKILLFLFSLVTAYNFLKFSLLGITYYVYNISAIISLICILLQYKRINKAILHAIKLSFLLDLYGIRRNYITILCICFCILLFIINFVGQIEFIFDNYETRLKIFHFFGITMDENVRALIFQIYTGAMLFTYTTNIIAIIYISLLCSKLYESLGKIVEMYRKLLLREFSGIHSNERFIFKFIAIFRKIVTVVSEVDSALSKCSLFLFGTYISCFFHTLSAIISKKDTYKMTISTIITLSSSTIAVFQFLILVNSASIIIKEDEMLKRTVILCAEKMFYSNKSGEFSLPRLQSISLLCDSIRGISLCVNAGGMFQIQKGVILKMTGAVITYGVLLFQLGY